MMNRYPPYYQNNRFGLGLYRQDVYDAPQQSGNVRTLGRDIVSVDTDFFPYFQTSMVRIRPYYTSGKAYFVYQSGPVKISSIVMEFGVELEGYASAVEFDLLGFVSFSPLNTALTAIERVVADADPILVASVNVSVITAADYGGDFGLIAKTIDQSVSSPVAPLLTTGQIFSGDLAAPTQGMWRTLVGHETSAGLIRFMGLVVSPPPLSPDSALDSRTHILVTFCIDPGTAAVVEPAEEVASDVPFEPHQITGGFLQRMDGQDPVYTLWCAGRYSPNTLVQATPNVAGIWPTAVANVGEGIWSTTDREGFQGWSRVASSPLTLSQHTEEVSAGQANAGNSYSIPPVYDLGVVYDEAWQRLQLAGVGTDSSQDPHTISAVEV